MILERTDILFNDLILLRSRAGIATVADQLILHFPKVEKDLHLVRLSDLLLMAPVRAAFSKKKNGKSAMGGGSGSKELLLQGLRGVSRWVLEPIYRPELFHDTDTLALPMGRKSIATIHDLSVLLFPQWHPAHRVKNYRRHFKSTVQRTNRFLANSESTKSDFCQVTGVEPARVTVAHLAPRPQFQPQSLEVQRHAREQFSDGKKFYLFLSTLEPRKNVPGLLDAWEKTSKSFREEHKLLLVGAWGWEDPGLAARLKGEELSRSVRWLGSVDDSALVPLVSAAQALVYPSFYEGFGLPPVEAMACGTPVISSDKGALKETLGSAAWIIDPNAPDSIREAMEQIGADADWREKGIAHASKFSWEKFARTTARLYHETLSS